MKDETVSGGQEEWKERRKKNWGRDVLITARTSPWKSESRNLVLRRKARAHAGSRCSTTDMRCESKYAICLNMNRSV